MARGAAFGRACSPATLDPVADPPKPGSGNRETARLTQLLREATAGRPEAGAEILPLVYDRLRGLARAKIAQLPAGQTLQTTALVHEAWLQLVGDEDPGWECQAHFIGAAASAMRDIIVDNARRKSRLKRGGDLQRAERDPDQIVVTAVPVDDVLAMNEALDALEQYDPRKAHVVTLRCFGGLTMPEVARATGLSLATVEREWRFARAWIQRRVEGS